MRCRHAAAGETVLCGPQDARAAAGGTWTTQAAAPAASNSSTYNPRYGGNIVTPHQPPRPLPPVKRATSAPVRSRVASAIKGSSRPVTPSSSSSSRATPATSSSNFLETHLMNQGSKRDTHPLALIGLAGGGPSGLVWFVHFHSVHVMMCFRRCWWPACNRNTFDATGC